MFPGDSAVAPRCLVQSLARKLKRKNKLTPDTLFIVPVSICETLIAHFALTGERNSRPAAGCLWWGDREGDWGARGVKLRWIEIQKEFDAGAARWSDVGEDETEVHLATGKAAERSINSTQQCNCANNSATQVEMQRSAPDCNQLHYLRCWSRRNPFSHTIQTKHNDQDEDCCPLRLGWWPSWWWRRWWRWAAQQIE